MLKEILLDNFKLFEKEVAIPLSNINLLTGINGRGKSTVLQSFLLMKQSPEFNRTTDKLIFNGSYVQLGNIGDVKNVNKSLNDFLRFGFVYEGNNYSFKIEYKFKAQSDDSLDAKVRTINVQNAHELNPLSIDLSEEKVSVTINDKIREEYPSLYNLFVRSGRPEIAQIEEKLNFTKIHYVSADRIGPKLYYTKSSLSDFPTVGALGENTVNVLFHKRNEKVYSNLCSDGAPKIVIDQAEYWIREIFDGAKVKLDEIKGTDLLSFRYSTGMGKTTSYNLPTNVGYGYSYVFPIIISGLIAKKGEILVVENPEAHLHPSAQSKLALFLTLVSKNGVQVFIESHSEHILNGLRIAVFDGQINPNNLNVLYFNDSDMHFKQIKVDKKGGIDFWPEDFFDQATKDLNHLFNI